MAARRTCKHPGYTVPHTLPITTNLDPFSSHHTHNKTWPPGAGTLSRIHDKISLLLFLESSSVYLDVHLNMNKCDHCLNYCCNTQTRIPSLRNESRLGNWCLYY
jgi:hypothetical protein